MDLLVKTPTKAQVAFNPPKANWVAKTSQDQFPPSFLDNCSANIADSGINFNMKCGKSKTIINFNYIRFVKRYNYWIVFIVLYLIQSRSLYAQLYLDNAPKDNAFLARNINTNKAVLILKGTIMDPAYTSLQINIYQNHSLKNSYNFSFNFYQSNISFSQKIDLTAGKYIYTIEYKLTGTASYNKTIDGVMVGDAYIVQGQSNAVAANYVNSAINYSIAYNDTFIKSFGSLYSPYDTAWYKADGENYYSKGSIGQWPMVLAKSLLDSFGIPICILNGAIGGTAIWQHVRTSGNSIDLGSIYGLLLYRVRKAQLENSIRGILYFQGESDGSNANLHDSLFKEIYGCWNQDFKGFKKLYVVQVRGKGCGSPSIQLREYQRQFGTSLSKCTVISSNGLNNHDGCHYGFSNGYELLGKQLAALVSRDLYQSKNTKNIDPPNIKNCYYSNANQNEITINMQNNIDNIYADNLFQKIFKIEGDNTVSITNGLIRNNKIVLQLNKSSCNITGLTYDSDVGTQPWVKNALQMGLISFYNVPILKNQIKPFYSGCKKASITMGEDSISGCKYLWKRQSTKQNYSTARIKIRGDSIEAFSLIIAYGLNACKSKDTLTVYISPDPVSLPELGPDQTICKSDSLILSPDYFGYSQFKWTGQNYSSFQPFYIGKSAEKIILVATSQRQCIYKDSILINISSPQIKLPDDIIICPQSDTLITIGSTYTSYQWNKQIGTNQYRSGAGLLIIDVTNNLGCKASDTTEIHSFIAATKPFLKVQICKNENKLIKRPMAFNSWYFQATKLATDLLVVPDKIYPIVLIDSNNCKLNDTIQTIGMTVPSFSMGMDTGYCKMGNIAIQLPTNMTTYLWNNVILNNPLIKLSTPGTYIAKITNSQECEFADTIEISEFELPDLNNFHDTILCRDSSWQITLDDNINYTINTTPVYQQFVFTPPGFYNILASSKYHCISKKSIQVGLKDCNNSSINYAEKVLVKLYPNPVNLILNIEFPFDGTYANIFSIEGRLVLSAQLFKGFNSIDLSGISSGSYYIVINDCRYLIIKN